MVGFIGVNQRPTSSVNPDEIARKMRLDYLYSQKDLNQKALDGVQTLFEHFQRREFDLDAFMNDALNLIRRRLWIREVTVALLTLEILCWILLSTRTLRGVVIRYEANNKPIIGILGYFATNTSIIPLRKGSR